MLLGGCTGRPAGDAGTAASPQRVTAATAAAKPTSAANERDRFAGRVAMPTVPPGFLKSGRAQAAAGAPPLPATAPAAASSAPAQTAPAIVTATIAPAVVHNGEAMTWTVRTTSDVVAVTAHVSMYALPLQRVGPGKFALSFTVPSNVPGVFHGTYDLSLVAADASGATATRTLPLVFQ